MQQALAFFMSEQPKVRANSHASDAPIGRHTKSERANRPWVMRAHQAAAAAIVHNRERESIWRWI
jgi:hypothetical protein